MHKEKREQRIQGRGTVGKTVVHGMLERGGEVRVGVVGDQRKGTLQSRVRANVEPGTAVCTDALRSYEGLDNEFVHGMVDHSAGQYVDGRVHTNGMENFWSLLKRALKGTYVAVAPWHLFRYLADGQGARLGSGLTEEPMSLNGSALPLDSIHCGDSRILLDKIETASIALSVWSPPYFVGKSYEKHLTYDGWCDLLRTVIQKHFRILKPGGFLAVNIADILCFPDPTIPKIQAENFGGNRLPVTREDVLKALEQNPGYNRYQLAAALGVSEQTVDRRMKNNNIRGGKYVDQTRVNLVGPLVTDAAYAAQLYLYDRRIWAKDPAWENSKWHTNSYRAVDEFEYLYIFWKPGITKIDRTRLQKEEWAEWGSRAVWHFASVRVNDDHEAKFPLELPRRAIRLLTDPGETVLDCFLGSGTTAVAAIQEGRRYIGIDSSEKYVKNARRLCAATHPIHQRQRLPKSQCSAHANGVSS